MTEKAGGHHGQRVSALNKSKIYTQRGRRNDLEIVAASDSLEKPLKLGNEGKRRGWQRMRWINNVTDSMDMSLSKLWEMVKDREAQHAAAHGSQRVGHDLVTKQQQRPVGKSLILISLIQRYVGQERISSKNLRRLQGKQYFLWRARFQDRFKASVGLAEQLQQSGARKKLLPSESSWRPSGRVEGLLSFFNKVSEGPLWW